MEQQTLFDGKPKRVDRRLLEDPAAVRDALIEFDNVLTNLVKTYNITIKKLQADEPAGFGLNLSDDLIETYRRHAATPLYILQQKKAAGVQFAPVTAHRARCHTKKLRIVQELLEKQGQRRDANTPFQASMLPDVVPVTLRPASKAQRIEIREIQAAVTAAQTPKVPYVQEIAAPKTNAVRSINLLEVDGFENLRSVVTAYDKQYTIYLRPNGKIHVVTG